MKSTIYGVLSGILFVSCLAGKSGKTPEYELTLPEIKVVANPQYQASAEKKFQLEFTHLELKPIWNKRALEGNATLTLSPYAYPQDTLVLDAKHFIIKKVQIVGVPKKTIFNYDDSLQLKILLYKTFEPGEKIKVNIQYIARPYHTSNKDTFLKDITRGLYFINPQGTDSLVPKQMWSQGETQYNSSWFPTIDALNQKHKQEIYLTVDTALTTLSNGELLYSTYNGDDTKTEVWSLQKPFAPYLSMIAVGNWIKIKDYWRDSIPVNYYVEPAYKPYARLIFGKTPEMMEFFSEKLQYDFPWPIFSQVVARDFVAGAMENVTAVVHSEELQHDSRSHLDETFESVIVHELFHQWFGDLVTTESWANLTLNESFATYGENIWIRHEYGDDEAEDSRRKMLESYLMESSLKMEPIVNYYYVDKEDLFDNHRYEKGALVLMMLQHYLGDEVFFEGLRTYLENNAFGTAELANLRMSMEKVSGRDLQLFFKQWYLEPGHPQINVTQQYDSAKQILKVKVAQIQKRTDPKLPIFSFPVTIQVDYGLKTEKRQVWVKNTIDTFSFQLDHALNLVQFDADHILLADIKEDKPVNQWIYQYLVSEDYLSRYIALNTLIRLLDEDVNVIDKTTLNKIVSAAIHDKAWQIKELAWSQLMPLLENNKENYVSLAKKAVEIENSSKVRIAALTFIEEVEGDKAKDLYYRALEDSSYQMNAVALNFLLKHIDESQVEPMLKRIQGMENYPSTWIGLVLSHVYGTYPQARQAAYMHKVPYLIPYSQMYSFFRAYERWIDKMPFEMWEKELKFILSLDQHIHSGGELFSYQIFLNAMKEKMETLKKDNKLNAEQKKFAEIVLNELKHKEEGLKNKD